MSARETRQAPARSLSPAEELVLILAIGDIIGKPGRQAIKELLPGLREQYRLDLVIANGENAAGGLGLTPDTARELPETAKGT